MKYYEKNAFRRTVRWKQFSERFLTSKHRVCEICGCRTAKMYNCHHKYKDDYTNLAPNRFMCLCHECHMYCHRRQAYLKNIARNIHKFKWD